MKCRYLLILICFFTCNKPMEIKNTNPYIVVLGVAQDAGYPQANCNKSCCNKVWENPQLSKFVSCLGLVDPISKQQWLFDATPDIKFQLRLLEIKSNINPLSGIFLTHAHIGHYTGLMQLGKEVMGTKNLPVYTMERMLLFLKNNAPWSQLVDIKNINLIPMVNNSIIRLNDRISVSPFLVPHRDEYSETVGYKISTSEKSLIFIPDIDKWDYWDMDINEMIKGVDYAFLDATFYQDGELERDMSAIPHPFVKESMELFSSLSKIDKQKVFFIHFNHTNPLLIEDSDAHNNVKNKGFKIAEQGHSVTL